jgi:hypothetical protein
MATITCGQFGAAINNVYYAALDDLTKNLNAISLQDLVTHICTTYATILQPNINDNMAMFITGIEPFLLLAVYMCKQENCQTFALNASIPISEATMVSLGTKAALNCGGMELAWRKWKRCLIVDHVGTIGKPTGQRHSPKPITSIA